MKILLIFVTFLGISNGQKTIRQSDSFLNGIFPTGFQWGVATSPYQIEGAWNTDGKGEHIWDKFLHDRNMSNGDLAADSYHKYMDDIAILKSMEVDFYRFSFFWTRLFPDGEINGSPNAAGIAYYWKVINALVENGIKPHITIYIWDLPQKLQDKYGGWTNEALIEIFANYSRVLFTEFGHVVKDWTTFNEPGTFCKLGYGSGYFAPGLTEPAAAPYKCAHTVIKAHALTYRIYQDEFKSTQGGQVGIVLNADWNEPRINDTAHLETTDRALRFWFGWFAHPLYYGEYPPIMREVIDQKSLSEGLNESRLPSFDSNWTQIINGSIDFIGLNHYTSTLISPFEGTIPGDQDSNVAEIFDPNWEGTAAEWLKVVPWGFRKLLQWIDKEYKHPPIFVTENGFPDLENATTNDPRRVNYYQEYINEMLKAVLVDKVDVRGYTAWTLMDGLEWSEGYTQRFGIHYIDFSDPELKRVPKLSAICLTNIYAKNGFPDGRVCELTDETTEEPTEKTTEGTTTEDDNKSSGSNKIYLSVSVIISMLYLFGNTLNR